MTSDLRSIVAAAIAAAQLPPLLDAEDLGRALKVSPRTARRLIGQAGLGVRVGRKLVVVREDLLRALLAARGRRWPGPSHGSPCGRCSSPVGRVPSGMDAEGRPLCAACAVGGA